VAIDGRPVAKWTDVRNVIRSHPGRQIHITVNRHGAELTVAVVPDQDTESGHKIGVIDVFPQGEVRRLGPVRAVGRSAGDMGLLLNGFVHTAPRAFSPATLGLTGGRPSNQR